MEPRPSHGRLKLRAVVAIPVLAALAVGVWLGIEHRGLKDREGEEQKTHELRDQAKFLTESVWTRIDQIRARTLLALEKKSLVGETLLEVARAARSRDGLVWLTSLSAQGSQAQLKDRSSLALALSDDTARRVGVAAVSMPPDLVLAFPLGAELAVAKVDPRLEFSSFEWIRANSDPSRRRAYLTDLRGQVLVHSEKAFSGGDFSRTTVFSSAVRPLLTSPAKDRASRVRTGVFRSIDLMEVRAALYRVSELPIAVVIEDVIEGERMATRAQFFKSIGQGLLALGIIALLIFLATIATREKVIALMTERSPTPQTLVPEVSREISIVTRPRITVPTRERPREHTTASVETLLSQFDRVARQTKDTNSLLAMVTDTVARLTATQVVYFKFDERLKHLFLQFDAGFGKGRAPNAMACPMTDQAIADALAISRSGELISVTDYPPLQKLLSERLGVTFYEAWGVTSQLRIPTRDPKVKIPRLLGVLVILHPSFEAATRRESLYRVLRTTSEAHELQS